MSNKSKILIIEDDFKKKEDIKNFLYSDLKIEDVTIKESYQSGLRELIKNNFDLLLLDMSIPTWDKSINEPGGNFEKFGGYKILKEITRKKKPVDTILITMFDDFGKSDSSITLTELNNLLESEFPDIYKGAVYYNTREENWKENLANLIHNL